MSEQQISLGVTYWPRRRASAEGVLCSWADADPGALRDELGHIAELGFDTVRLELRWAEAQPGPSRLGSAALRGLERALDLAQERGLRAVVGLLSGSLGAVLHLPDWAVGVLPPARPGRPLPAPLPVSPNQPAVLAGDRYRREPARLLYSDPELRAAQAYLLREVLGYFAAHPAAAGWLLGAGLGRARRPPSAQAAAAWWSSLADQARSLGARAIYGQADAAGLGRADSLRPEAIHGAGGLVAVAAPPLPPLLPSPAAPTAPASFLHALTAGLLRAEARRAVPVVVADLGLPTAAPRQAAGLQPSEAFGRAADLLFVDEEGQASFVEAALAELQRAGAGAVWLAGYADQPEGLWRIPPLDRGAAARGWGLVSADGREKPAAAAVRAFAARLRSGALPAPSGPPTLPPDPERYWRDPQGGLRDLWLEWGR